uniref:Uncharacterized protein n=1 Tax=Rhizophora mucronata TaxID=61149 RepID=A0A2P2K8J3_RHIMU
MCFRLVLGKNSCFKFQQLNENLSGCLIFMCMCGNVRWIAKILRYVRSDFWLHVVLVLCLNIVVDSGSQCSVLCKHLLQKYN